MVNSSLVSGIGIDRIPGQKQDVTRYIVSGHFWILYRYLYSGQFCVTFLYDLEGLLQAIPLYPEFV